MNDDVYKDRNDRTTTAKKLLLDALLEHDYSLPSGPMEILQNVVLLGKAFRDRKKKREAFQCVVVSILEQIFDPALEFRMTYKDILDCFEANGLSRSSVSNEQVSQIYVRVLQKLRVGELRDLTYEEDLHRYVKMKMEEIESSRKDWELNYR